jgi:hypothetical protein
MVRKAIYCLLILGSFLPVLNGQGEINEQARTLFTNEQSFGAFLNSNGFGADFTYGTYINARNRWLLSANVDYVKDPKEFRSLVPYDYYTRRFVFGKLNHFVELKGYAGRQTELFTKSDVSSISIRLFYQGGFSIGLLKPIYYEILTFNSSGQIVSSEEQQFDPAIHYYNYGGTAAFTRGLDEIKVVPGLTARAGLTFEYSEREPIVHALETGLGITVYPRDIPIMATDQQNFFFFQMYIGYRFGTLLDISDAARAKSREDRRKERKEAAGDTPMIPRIRF